MTITQEFINKVEDSFLTLSNKNGKYGIFDELVKETLENDPEKDQVLEVVYKILDLFNNSTAEEQKILFESEVSDVINMLK